MTASSYGDPFQNLCIFGTQSCSEAGIDILQSCLFYRDSLLHSYIGIFHNGLSGVCLKRTPLPVKSVNDLRWEMFITGSLNLLTTL